MKKKPSLKDLDKKRFLFFNIGLILALSATLVAFEWTSVQKTYAYDTINVDPPITLPPPIVLPKTKRQKTEVFKGETKPSKNPVFDVVPDDENIDDIPIPDLGLEDDTLFDIEIGDDTTPIDTIIIDLADYAPQFPGCDRDGSIAEQKACFEQYVVRHIQSSFKYPELCKQMGVEGRVYVSFQVNTRGEIVNVEAIRGQDCLIPEAKRLVQSVPNALKPAMAKGKAVSIKYTVPIVFKMR